MRYDVTPVPKPRMTRADKWKKRPCVVRYREFKDKCRELDLTPGDGQSIVFGMPMPKSWSKAKRERLNGQPHTTKADLDNLLKGLWDTLEEDSHIHHVEARKIWSETGYIEVKDL